MMKKGRTTRLVVNGVLLAAIVALGITVFRAGTATEDTQPVQPKIVGDELALAEEDPDKETPMVDAGTSHVEADLGEGNTLDTVDAADSNHLSENEAASPETAQTAGTSVLDEQADSGLISQVDFTENTLMQWPVEGNLVMDYSMDKTIYFPTLDQYKVSPAIGIGVQEGTQVAAAVAGTVTDISENEETGTTLTMDLGNGYEAVYGQLQDLTVSQGQTVSAGTVLGTVSAPTKYYSVEGSNLYFAMRKDNAPVDPITYLP